MAASNRREWPKGITTITLFVEDVTGAKRFYGNAFGLPVMFEDENSVVFDFCNMIVNLLATSAVAELIEPALRAPREAGSSVVLTLHVTDVDAKAKELTDRGVVLLNGPMDRPWGIRTASFTDPDGHIWEISNTIDGAPEP